MADWDEWIWKYENDCVGDTSAGSENYTRQPESSTSRIEKLKEGVRDIIIGDTSAGSKNSTKQSISPTSEIQKQPTDEWVDEWIKQYDNLSRLGICAGSTRKSVCPTSQIQKQSINLKVSLQMFLQEATSFADQWTDVNTMYDDRRSFPRFLSELQMLGMDWHKYMSEDSDTNVSNQPNRWSSLQAPSDDVVHLRSKLTSDPNWVMADICYRRSLSLMQLLHRIHHSESVNDFSREQAELLGSFLDHLLMLQQEQRVVAYSFSKHLDQLRKGDSAASLAFSSNAVDDDGDMIKCPLILSQHTMDSRVWRKKHQFASLYVILRESTWLLKKIKGSRFSSPSFVEESHKILEKIVGFTSEYKKSKENKEILYHFVKDIKGLQEEGVGKGFVIQKLLDCLVDVSDISMETDSSSSIAEAFMKAVDETAKLIQEARNKLSSDRFATLNGGSPLGNITLWRILFESSLLDLRLDLINKKHGEAIKLGVKLREHKYDYHVQTCLNGLDAKISLLLSDGDRVLREFVAMHRAVYGRNYLHARRCFYNWWCWYERSGGF
ncbi:midasin-like isoform X2 [Papaver somniferum]|uniref:midasin-like isoform X2 n=1 Tax=Papaver somniferum TaxID=3469 RepID=UPI000E6F4FD5|nr:midasin-like isoform X2 [Papaver somniferum]